MDDLAQELARVFAAELAEHLGVLRQGLAVADAGGEPDLKELFRRAHSLKGAARAVDQSAVETLAHALENLLESAEAAGALTGGVREDARGLIDAIEDAAEAGTAPAEETRPASEEDADDYVRVSARTLDHLADSVRALQEELDFRAAVAGNLTATRAEIDAIRQACSAPGATLAQIAGRLARLHTTSLDIATRRGEADDRVARAALAVEEDADRLLLVPAVSLASGLERMVREVAAESGKRAHLIVQDDGAEADRRVIQRLRDPVTQLLRNAIGHGIEPPDVRAARGKDPEGEIRLSLRAERGTLTVSVVDDGAGPDAAAIRASAGTRGLIDPANPPADDDALFALLFEHGFSTEAGAGRLSGRGVGLSVVADATRRLHGLVRLSRDKDGGTRVRIRVPLAATRRPALLVEAGGQTFAMPSRAISGLFRLDPRDIAPVEGVPAAVIDGKVVRVVPLAALVGLASEPQLGSVPAFLLMRGEERLLVAVDALVDVRPLVIGDPGEIAADVPLVLGVATTGEGQVVLALSASILFDRAIRGGRALAGPVSAAPPERRRTVLVVDDSITTRTLERGILEGQGYRVLLAVDGLDGLERLRAPDADIDLVVADVEMPRMDGFALLAAIRNDSALARIPVVMMTSRDAPDDVQRGLDLGADAYVTKQSFEQGELLSIVRRLI